MITNANKGTYLVKNGQKHDNVIYERPLMLCTCWTWTEIMLNTFLAHVYITPTVFNTIGVKSKIYILLNQSKISNTIEKGHLHTDR